MKSDIKLFVQPVQNCRGKNGKRCALYAVVQGENATKKDAPIDRLIEWICFNG